jgi:hypothetical protein
LVDPVHRLIPGTAIRLDAALITGDKRVRASSLVSTLLFGLAEGAARHFLASNRALKITISP